MSTRPTRPRMRTLEEILEALGDPDRIGKDLTWVGKEYSIRDLILDLKEVQKAHNSPKQ